MSNNNNKTALKNDTLIAIFTGYNDYYYYANDHASSPEFFRERNLTSASQRVVGYIIDNLEILYANGGRKFLVFNVPNMTQEPEALDQPLPVLHAYTVLVEAHNRALSSALLSFEKQHPGASTVLVDVKLAMECVNIQKRYDGFEDVIHACYPNGAGDEDEDCDLISGFKFWDDYHPTTKTHKLISETVIQAIHDAQWGQK